MVAREEKGHPDKRITPPFMVVLPQRWLCCREMRPVVAATCDRRDTTIADPCVRLSADADADVPQERPLFDL